jgi:hypothetical protein
MFTNSRLMVHMESWPTLDPLFRRGRIPKPVDLRNLVVAAKSSFFVAVFDSVLTRKKIKP